MAYTELDKSQNLIRLLHLSPASSQDDTIRCRFTVALLDDEPDYEALSYTWGDVNDTRSIEVEGSSRVVSITSNLHLALKYLRFEHEERTLWVDALCINQADLKERTHQVSRMKSIYGQASQVVVWLGEAWEGCDTAMEFLRTLAEDKSLHLDPAQEPSISVHGLDTNSSQLCSHIIHLFNLPWWKRTWTVQEFVLAQKLVFQCSRYLITREMMMMANVNFWSHRKDCCMRQIYLEAPDIILASNIIESFRKLDNLDYITKRRKQGSCNILDAITLFANRREATDPRDKLYGMLGLGTGDYADLVDVDYMLAADEVCEAVVIKSVERTGKLEFLSHLFGGQNPKLPSFIPDWTRSFATGGARDPNYSHRLIRFNLFNASLNTRANWKAISRGIACSPGITFDVVTSTSSQTLPSTLDLDRIADFLKEVRRLADIEGSSEELYGHTTDSRLLALWYSLCGGVQGYMQDSIRYIQRLKGSTDLSLYTKFMAYFTASDQLRAELLDYELSHIYANINLGTNGRRFFTTRKGYFGVGHEKCEVGDLVVVLAGGNYPYVIRPVPSTDEYWAEHNLCARTSYRMLGDLYVHGIMDGEVLELGDETCYDELHTIKQRSKQHHYLPSRSSFTLEIHSHLQTLRIQSFPLTTGSGSDTNARVSSAVYTTNPPKIAFPTPLPNIETASVFLIEIPIGGSGNVGKVVTTSLTLLSNGELLQRDVQPTASKTLTQGLPLTAPMRSEITVGLA
ncbi:Heterokaryon incompatibility protein 6,OR allele [Lachnellula cervina]|uniref:Heterokaryon incompatibility protein 6,OR allele n=1 Tax=Lachnellula cervina TaxID=1316786 RepID=A0A7D8YMC0_9HELO|nr:Heterokaryon incompatibility protein 6,OR allele [Lachnellula cervina]